MNNIADQSSYAKEKHINKNETTSKAATYCVLNDTGNVLTNF